MVMSAVLRQQQAMQWFASSPAQEGRVESLYYRSHISDLTIAAAKAWPECLLIKIKGASTAWGSPSHTAEQYGHSGWHLVLVLVWSCSVSSSAMHFATRSRALALASNSIPKSKCCSWGPYGMKVRALSNLCHRFLILALHVLKGVSRRREYKWSIFKDDGL